MLQVLIEALDDLLSAQHQPLSATERIELSRTAIGKQTFSRKDYLLVFKDISAPTASRDLKLAVDRKLVTKKGTKRLADTNLCDFTASKISALTRRAHQFFSDIKTALHEEGR